jgi:transposase-like protein
MTPADPTTVKPRQNAKQIGRPKPKRPYTEDDKATALSLLQSNGNNLLRTATELGIPQSTLFRWRRGGGLNRAIPAKRDAKTAELDALFERVARLYLENAGRSAVVKKSRGKDSVIAACAAVDKLRLLRGEATSIRESTGDSGPKISILVVPAATDPGGRVYTSAELRELTSGSGELGPASDGSTAEPPRA